MVLATPWFLTAWLLWSAWLAEAPASTTTPDSPARLLAAAIATLPEDRRDWGAAMTAELAQVPTRPGRWRFALGCARVAIFLPRSNRGPVVAAAVFGAAGVGVAGLTLGEVVPPMRVFTMTFVGLIGAAAAVTLARARPRARRTSGPLVMTAGIAGVTACIAATWSYVDRHPAAALYLHPGDAILLAAILVGALWLVAAPPPALTGDPLGRRIAAGVTLLLAVGLLVTARFDPRGHDEGIFGYLFLAPLVAICATALVMAAVRRSAWAGVRAAVWTALLVSLAFYAISVSEAARIYTGDGYPVHILGGTIRELTVLLVLFPSLWLPFGCAAAAVGYTMKRN